MQEIKRGFVRWFDRLSNDGILTCLETGRDYYFNSFSFPNTVYVVTGICKVTGKEKTVETRGFPGLFLSYKIKPDQEAERAESETPVRFRQADGIEQCWAVDIQIDESLADEVNDFLITCALDGMLSCDLGDEKYPKVWKPNYERRLERLINKMEGK